MTSIEATVTDWPGIEIGSHDRGGREFTLHGREIGHIHGERLLDIPFPKRVRDVLIEEDRAEKHHVVPESGWISYRIRTDDDVADALWLLRLSYLHQLAVLRTWEETQVASAIDIEAELAELEPSEALSLAVSVDG